MSGKRQALKVVTIGAGYFAGFHVEAWLRNQDTDFRGLADLDRSKAWQLVDAHAGKQSDIVVSDTIDGLLAETSPDIIDIAAPPSAHFKLLEQALTTKARAIICQKPFCTSLEEARKAVRMIEAQKRLVVVHENFRFQPWYRIIRAEIDAGRIGDLYQITFRLRPGDGQGKSAYLDRQPYFQKMERFLVHETAIHWIDTFRFLMGEPSSVMADLRRLNPVIAGEDAGLLVYRYEDGRRAIFDGNRLADHAADNPRLTLGECIIEGSKGTITLNGFGDLLFRPFGSNEFEKIGGDYSRDKFGGDCVYALQKHVSDHLIFGTPIENDAVSYLRNVEIEQHIYDAAISGRTIDLER